MQSIFGLLGHVLNRSSHALQRHRPAGTRVDLGDTRACPPVLKAIPSPTVVITPRAEAPLCKSPLRVKLHRDNQRDCSPFPTRLVISGRMADVHAELERLAAMEALT